MLTIFPETDIENSGGYLDFNMHAVNEALVNIVKELKAENDRLKVMNEQIVTRLTKLEAAISVSAMK